MLLNVRNGGRAHALLLEQVRGEFRGVIPRLFHVAVDTHLDSDRLVESAAFNTVASVPTLLVMTKRLDRFAFIDLPVPRHIPIIPASLEVRVSLRRSSRASVGRFVHRQKVAGILTRSG